MKNLERSELNPVVNLWILPTEMSVSGNQLI